MTEDDLKLLAACVAGFGAGFYWFFKGFGIYREFRVIEDTPSIPIRSISMGLVHIHGKASGEESVTSPVSDTPCLYYHVNVEKWVTGGRGGGRWTPYRSDSKGEKFYLEDPTGKAAVNASGAEFNLAPTSVTVTRRTHAPALGSLASKELDPRIPLALYEVSDNRLNAYADRLGARGHSLAGTVEGLALHTRIGLAASFDEDGGPPRAYRFTEFCIRSGESYDVTGSCVENPEAADIHDRNLITKGENEPTFLITSRSAIGIEQALRRGAILRVLGGATLAVTCLAVILWKLRLL